MGRRELIRVTVGREPGKEPGKEPRGAAQADRVWGPRAAAVGSGVQAGIAAVGRPGLAEAATVAVAGRARGLRATLEPVTDAARGPVGC